MPKTSYTVFDLLQSNNMLHNAVFFHHDFILIIFLLSVLKQMIA